MEGDSYKPQEYTITRVGTGRHYTRRTFSRGLTETYESKFETLDPESQRCYWKAGDIVQFGSAFRALWKVEEAWPKWFIEDPDEYWQYLKNNLPRNNVIPMYAHFEYAIILARYKWTKYKYTTFRDYGSIIMMLTGKRAGHIRRYYTTCPWSFIVAFPYDKFGHKSFKKKVMPLIEDVLDPDLQTFLKNITEKYHD